jgi:chemotaxis protein MotA
MDIGSLVGLLLAIGLPVGAIFFEGHAGGFLSAHASIIVFGGILGITILSFPPSRIVKIPKVLSLIFFPPRLEPVSYVSMFRDFSDRARREGILVLEDEVLKIEDPFLKKAIRMAVDGVEPNGVREALESEIASIEDRHNRNIFVFENLANNGPAFAMIGTLIGMVGMLQHMESPSEIGPNMAVALLATLYGAMIGYCVGFPVVNRLREIHAREIQCKEMIVEGMMGLQSGENPRMVEVRLLGLLSQQEQAAFEQQRAG